MYLQQLVNLVVFCGIKLKMIAIEFAFIFNWDVVTDVTRLYTRLSLCARKECYKKTRTVDMSDELL